MHNDFCDFGYVAEGARFLEQAQDLTLASRTSQWTVLEVGRGTCPFAQTLLVLGLAVARGVVLVGEGEEVCGYGALVRLLKTRQAEGAGLEETRGGIRGGGWLMWVERPAVVLGRAVLVSAGRQLLLAPSAQSAAGYGVEVLDSVGGGCRNLERRCGLDVFDGCSSGGGGRGVAALAQREDSST